MPYAIIRVGQCGVQIEIGQKGSYSLPNVGHILLCVRVTGSKFVSQFFDPPGTLDTDIQLRKSERRLQPVFLTQII